MRLAKRKLMEVALSIRERHFQNLLDECREARREVSAARRSRRGRARLIRLARKHRLSSCLERLRPKGMTLETGCGLPYITYDHRITNGWILMQKEHCRDVRTTWRRLKEESVEPIVANLKTLFQETELVQEKPLEVRWIVDNVTLNDVWIGDMDVTMNLDQFKVRVWNISVDTEEKGGCQHPHVASDGHICWNSHDEEAQEYHASGDFLALKDMIENLLRTYNPQSPYINLEDWENGFGESCGDCGERWPSDELSYSERYGELLCPNCRYWCDRCEECVPDHHYNAAMEACDRCVEQDSDVCTLCLERFWRDDLTTIEMTIDDKEETVPCCETCKEEYESEQEENEKAKEENEDESERNDHADSARLLAAGVALPPNA